MRPLVTAAWVAAHLGDPALRLVDCRFALGDPDAGRRQHRSGHLPGAAFLDLDRDLAGPPAGARHPLPDVDAFVASARRAGIGRNSVVVAYDQHMAGGAARLWWLLRHVGHDAVAVLDGGIDAWEGPLETGEVTPSPGDLEPRVRDDDVVDAEEIAARLGDPGLLLVDARAPERFRGEHEPIDPVAGHVPGAANLPSTAAFPPPAGLVAADEEVVVYCGSGVTATVLALALADTGRDDVRLYPGSWSDWVARGLPVETGPGRDLPG